MSEIEVSFCIHGEPIGKARPRVTKFGAYTPKKTKDYEELVRSRFREMVESKKVKYDADNVKFAEVCISAYFGVPKSWSKAKKEMHYNQPTTKKPDADNIAKIICDALNGVAYKDDSCIGELDVRKRYCGENEAPFVAVTVVAYFG